MTAETQTPQAQPPAVQQAGRNIAAGARIAAIVPRDLAEAARLVDALCAAGMIPASYEVKDRSGNVDGRATKARMMIGLMKAMEVGFPPITGINTIMVVNNRACVWGDGAVALVQDAGALEYMTHEVTGKQGTDELTHIVTMKRKGQEKPYVGKFSIKDAKTAKLWNNPKRQPWMMYPDRMLFNRARAFALRDGFADCLHGLSIAEEMMDVEPTDTPKAMNTDFLNDDVSIPAAALAAPDNSDLLEMPAPAAEGDARTFPNGDKVPVTHPDRPGFEKKAAICAECKGRGLIEWKADGQEGTEPCNSCKGTGKAVA